MKIQSNFSRRDMLRSGAGAVVGVLAAATSAGSMAVTPSNPEGPFYPQHKQSDMDADLTLIDGHSEHAAGDVIRVSGRVLDEHGEPIEGALVDIWQANAHGRYHHEDDTSERPEDPNFQGWAMMKTDADGRYSFRTIKPGAYTAMGDSVPPPHIHYKVSRRGYRELTTQMYWDGDPLNDKDRLLLDVPAEERSALLVAFDESKEVPEGAFNVTLSKVSAA